MSDEYESGSEGSEDGKVKEILFPWGKRPNFREMLEGGNKKLVLTEPPEEVIEYYKEKVERPIGCAYDNGTNTFFATSPGSREGNDGQVLALSGNCNTSPICVAKDLTEPAAIAVYEPGKSVAVVTNRGIFVFTRRDNEDGEVSYISRKITYKNGHRGIAVTAAGAIVSFSYGKIRMLDGSVSDGQERVLVEVNYDPIINDELFRFDERRFRERSSCCFMDIVNNRLVMSDLKKHVVSLWDIEETSRDNAIHFVRAIDVGIDRSQMSSRYLRPEQIPMGKCAFAAGIRLDEEGWVLCADAEGRTIQIFDNELRFITRVDTTPGQLPYISALYIEANGHLMVCDRRSEMGGLRVFMLDAVEGEAAAAGDGGQLQQLQQGGRPYPDRILPPQHPSRYLHR